MNDDNRYDLLCDFVEEIKGRRVCFIFDKFFDSLDDVRYFEQLLTNFQTEFTQIKPEFSFELFPDEWGFLHMNWKNRMVYRMRMDTTPRFFPKTGQTICRVYKTVCVMPSFSLQNLHIDKVLQIA